MNEEWLVQIITEIHDELVEINTNLTKLNGRQLKVCKKCGKLMSINTIHTCIDAFGNLATR